MRRVSSKHRRYLQKHDDQRRMWSAGHTHCWICGWPKPFVEGWRPDRLETHEIVRRSQAPGNYYHEENYFRTCGLCHSTKLATMKLAKQLAYKYLNDPWYYDIDKIRSLLDNGRQPVVLTEDEVDTEVRLLMS